MNRLDYMVQVEDLHASPELRARISALAGEVRRPRRRFRPWMGVCAALAVVVLGGAWLVTNVRMGGSSGSGGGGHDEASTFMSYAGPVFPLTLEDENDSITAQRHTTLDFAPWEPVWVEADYLEEGGYWSRSTDILVTDSYTLTNSADQDQTVTLLYPFVASLDTLDQAAPLLTADGAALDTTLRAGGYSGGFEGAWNGVMGGEPEGSVNLDSAGSWEDYKALLSDGSYLERALGPLPDLSGVPAIVYRFTDPWGEAEDEEAGRPNPTIRVTFRLDYDKTQVLTTGFHSGLYDRENGIMGKGFSIPQPEEQNATEEWCLIVVGEDISDLTTQGYVTGGWDTEETIESGVTMERYETDLDTALRTLYLDRNWAELEGQPGLTYEMYCGLAFDYLLSYGLLSDTPAERYGDGMLSTEFAHVDRVCWLETQVTVPAGGSITVEASFAKPASFNYTCTNTEYRGVYGYDLVTKLGSNLTCTEQTATLEDRGLIQIIWQNFGFDLENGVNTVTLDPAEEHYYLEVKRLTE